MDMHGDGFTTYSNYSTVRQVDGALLADAILSKEKVKVPWFIASLGGKAMEGAGKSHEIPGKSHELP